MRHQLVVVAYMVISTAASAAKEPLSGQLHIQGEASRAYACGGFLQPAPVSRFYTLSADSDPIYTLGILNAGESAIPCSGFGTFELNLSARQPSRGDVRLSIGDPSSVFWQVSIPERQTGKKITVNVPRGTYELSIERRGDVRVRKTVVVGELATKVVAELRPLPRINGVIVARATGRPVAGASIGTDVTEDDVDQTAISDADGRFSLEADPERWPTKVVVRAIPFAETTASVPAARVTTTLPDIYVSRGGTVSVQVKQKEPGQVVEVELLPIIRNSTTGKAVATLPVPREPSTESLRFENVEPGPYVVLAKGDLPLERHGSVIDVTAATEVKVAVAIEPFSLRVGTKVDGETLLTAGIAFSNLAGYWEGPIEIEDGRADVELWQGGRVRAMVSATGFSAPFIARRTLSGEQDDEWILDVPARELTGRVIDSRTGEPIAGAALSLHVDENGSSFGVWSKADGEGRFRIFPVPYGKHRLRVAGAHYPPTELTYLFLDPEQNREMTVRLDRAETVTVTITDHAGAPLPLARVIQMKDGMRIQAHTDSSGRVEVSVPTGGTADVYVLPRDGTFAIATLEPDMKETVIRVAPGSARIVIRAETEEHVPIPNVPILARYNGHLIPADVFDALAGTRGGRIASEDGRLVLAHMPAGSYEFWPVASVAQLRAVEAGHAEPRVRMVVAPGENVAVMTLTPAAKD